MSSIGNLYASTKEKATSWDNTCVTSADVTSRIFQQLRGLVPRIMNLGVQDISWTDEQRVAVKGAFCSMKSRFTSGTTHRLLTKPDIKVQSLFHR
jgi:hypothetical protein